MVNQERRALYWKTINNIIIYCYYEPRPAGSKRKETIAGMNKKAIAILGAIFILIIAVLGVLIYSKYYEGRQTEKNTSENNSTNVQNENQDAPSGDSQNNGDQAESGDIEQQNGFVKLTETGVVTPVLFFNGRGVTYFDDSDRLMQADLVESSNALELSRERELLIPYKAGITRILWPEQGNKFIAETQSFVNKSWSLYNGDLGVYADLPLQIISLDWMPSGDKIAYVWLEDGKATLNISNPDTTNWQEISEMWELDNIIRVSPDGQNVLYFRGSSQEETNAINITNLDGTLWQGLVKTGFNFGALWSPDGQKFLFGKKDPVLNQFSLWVYDMITGESQDLGINTEVEKAVWDKTGRVVYVAGSLGGSLDSFASEKIYKIDLNTLAQTEYDPGSLNIDASDLFLNSAEDKVFFKNNTDGSLYYLDLLQ